MRCRERPKREGDILTVTNGVHYPLPPGLKAGDRVRLLRFDHGYWTVDHKGREYRVFTTRIDSGLEFELRGRWLPPDHPAVIAHFGRSPERVQYSEPPTLELATFPNR